MYKPGNCVTDTYRERERERERDKGSVPLFNQKLNRNMKLLLRKKLVLQQNTFDTSSNVNQHFMELKHHDNIHNPIAIDNNKCKNLEIVSPTPAERGREGERER